MGCSDKKKSKLKTFQMPLVNMDCPLILIAASLNDFIHCWYKQENAEPDALKE